MKKIISVTVIMFLASRCYAGGLDNLIDVAKAQGEMQKVYAQETKTYDIVEAAIGTDAIEKGQTKDDIQNRYGEPVVSLQDEDSGREKWIYKPASSSYFEGPKIYLYFDKDGNLDEIKKAG